MDDKTIIKQDLVTQRPGSKEDHAFIYASWLQGLYYGNYYFREIDKDIFFKHYNKVIEYLLNKKNSIVVISCLREDPDVILGYAVCEPTILHWVFIKEPWRKLGLARDIIPKETQVVTHLTEVACNIKPKIWVFNPFIT